MRNQICSFFTLYERSYQSRCRKSVNKGNLLTQIAGDWKIIADNKVLCFICGAHELLLQDNLWHKVLVIKRGNCGNNLILKPKKVNSGTFRK